MNTPLNVEVQSFSTHCLALESLVCNGFQQKSFERIPATKAISESYKLELANLAGMRVEVLFHPLPNVLGVFVVYIYSDKHSEPINLKDWLKKHEKLVDQNMFKLSNYAGSSEDKFGAFFEYLNLILNDNAVQGILRGEVWEEIPFDWTGIK